MAIISEKTTYSVWLTEAEVEQLNNDKPIALEIGSVNVILAIDK